MRRRAIVFSLVFSLFGIWASSALAVNGNEVLTVSPNSNLAASDTVTVSGTGFNVEQVQLDQCVQNTGPSSCAAGPIVQVMPDGSIPATQVPVAYAATTPACDTTTTQSCFIDAIYTITPGGVRAPITFAGHVSTDTFAVGVTGTPGAGSPFSVTLTAMNGMTTDTFYTGTHAIAWGGGAGAPNGSASPSYPVTSVAFTNGVATTTLSATYVKAGQASLSATDDSSPSVTGTANFTVAPAAAASLALSVDDTSVTAGDPHQLTITALDQYGNTATNYASPQNLTFTGATQSPNATVPTAFGAPFGTPTSVTFTAGVASGSMTLFNASESPTVNFTGGSVSSAAALGMTVSPAGAATLALVPSSATITAGNPDSTTITAYDLYGNTATGYTGTKTLTFGGAATSPNGTHPTFTDSTSSAVNFGTATSVVFSSGAASGVMTLYDAEGPTVTVGDGTIGGGGPSMTVNAAAANKLVLGAAATSTAGASLPATIAALDPYGNTDPTYTGTKNLTFSGAAASPSGTQPTFAGVAFGTATPTAFTTGTASGTIKLYKAQNAGLHVVDDSTPTPLQNGTLSVAVSPAAVSHFAMTAPTSNQVAGTPFNVDLQALDPYDNPTTYAGTLDWSGAGTSTGPVATAPVYPSSVSFDSSGHATASGITLYKAETATLTAADHATPSISGSGPVTVVAAPTSQLKLTPSTASPVAGTAFSVGIQALDPYGNTPSDYAGSKTINWTGPSTSPGPVATAPTTASPSTLTFSATGFATASGVKLFKAQTVTLGAADSATPSIAGSTALNVGPAPASQFATSIDTTTVIAGDSHTLAINALDPYGNVDINYTGTKNVTFAGANPSPNNTKPTFAGTNFGSIGVPFSAGAASGTLQLYKAESPTITLTQGTITNGTGLAMIVKAAPPASVAFTQQPTEVQAVSPTGCLGGDPFACFISHYTAAGGVQAFAQDAFGNPANNNASISIALTGTPPAGASLGGTTTSVPTGSDGKVTFSNLTLNVSSLGYKLKVTASPGTNPTATSNPFTVAQTLTTCSGSCNGSANDTTVSTVSVSATNVGSGVTVKNTLGLAFAPSQRPSGVCAGFVDATLPNGQPINGSYVDVTQNTTGGTPILTLTWTLLKSIVQVQPDNGAAHYNVCLGAVYLPAPSSTTTTPWTTQSGAPAIGKPDPNVVDPVTGNPVIRFWGIVPDCKNVPSNNPCVVSRSKDKATGNLIFVYRVPYPWDPAGALGG